MRRIHALGFVLLLPALVALLAAPGCSKKDDTTPGKGTVAMCDQGGKGGKNGGKPAAGSGVLTELASTGWGTLTGKVTYAGDPPTPKENIDPGNKDVKNCHAGASKEELIEQTWIVNKDNKGVENVVIYLRAPEGKYFKIKDED